jgi:hypothetical protein
VKGHTADQVEDGTGFIEHTEKRMRKRLGKHSLHILTKKTPHGQRARFSIVYYTTNAVCCQYIYEVMCEFSTFLDEAGEIF